MWGALKKDFGEFVATVTTDANDALQQLDQGLDNVRARDVEDAPLIDPDTGMPIDYDSTPIADDEDDVVAAPPDLPPEPGRATDEEMTAFLMACDEVFLDELDDEEGDDDDDVSEFLRSFDVGTKTDEISSLLEAHPTTLGQTFSRLNDRVEYADFWARYFYRLGPSRLEATYGEYRARAVTAREAANAAGNKINIKAAVALSNVTSFLGGVVHRLVEENDADDDADDDEEIVNDDQDGGPKGPRFGAFLTRTAVVRRDDDDNNNNNSEEEEEELGWDDDEDDEDDDADEDGTGLREEDDKNETVEFKDAEKEKLQDDLVQAREERDMLHKTVEMQAEEIKRLKEAAPTAPVPGEDESSQVQALQMRLFEKDSELAALRAELDDLKNDERSDDKYESEATSAAAAAAQEIDRLREIIASKEKALTVLLSASKHDEEDASAAAAQTARALEEMREVVASKDREIAELRSAVKDDGRYEAEASAVASQLARELDELREVVAGKDRELRDVRGAMDESTRQFQARVDEILLHKEQAEASLRSQIAALQESVDRASSSSENDEWTTLLHQKDEEIASLQLQIKEVELAARASLDQQMADLNGQLFRAQADAERAAEETAAARYELATIRSENTQLRSDVDAGKAYIAELKTELEQAQSALKVREAELQQAKRPSSPGSNSTGVKVQPPEPPAVTAIEAPVVSTPVAAAVVHRKVHAGEAEDNDEDDGWGDDW